MLFSIIIPACNSAGSLQQTLESILSQTYKNVEVVIIDGLSTDGTLQIIESYMQVLTINLSSEKDEGIYDAMNVGIRRAKGEWLYFLGSDDVLFNDLVLEEVFKSIDGDDEIVYGDMVWVPSGKMEKGVWSYERFINQNINHQRIFYKACLFKAYGNYNLLYKFASDHELNIRFFCNDAIKKKHIPVMIARFHAYGFSANKIDEDFWNNWKMIVRNNFVKHLPEKQVYGSLGRYCLYNIDSKKYIKALRIFVTIVYHTRSVSFAKSTVAYFLRGLSKNTPEKSIQ